MMKKILLLPYIFITVLACDVTKESQENKESQKNVNKIELNPPAASTLMTEKVALLPSGTVYRCDGFRPGMVSEWVQVAYSEDLTSVMGIWYWNVQEETKMPLKILEINFVPGEISGFSGKLAFQDDADVYEFGIIEDRFNLISADQTMQTFEFEQ